MLAYAKQIYGHEGAPRLAVFGARPFVCLLIQVGVGVGRGGIVRLPIRKSLKTTTPRPTRPTLEHWA